MRAKKKLMTFESLQHAVLARYFMVTHNRKTQLDQTVQRLYMKHQSFSTLILQKFLLMSSLSLATILETHQRTVLKLNSRIIMYLQRTSRRLLHFMLICYRA